MIHKKNLSKIELEEIFKNAPIAPNDIFANKKIIEKYEENKLGENNDQIIKQRKLEGEWYYEK